MAAVPPSPSLPPVPLPAGSSAGDSATPLRRRRDELAEQVAEQQWDLGGLAYEMAIRDHFRLDVLVRRAAQLQASDAELAEVERLLRLEDSASVGSCPSCAAPHSRGALFCWQCGATLMERAPSAAVPAVADAGSTAAAGSSVPAGSAGLVGSAGQAGPTEQAGSTVPAGSAGSERDARGERDTLIMNPIAAKE